MRAQVQKLAAACGNENVTISDSEIIPETGLLDSAAVVQLVVWVEATYSIPLEEDEITIENLGSVDKITSFVMGRAAT